MDPSSVDYLLGLFAPSHMEYFHEQDKHDDPTLAEMTQMALQILGRNPNGFFLFVEGRWPNNLDTIIKMLLFSN